MDMLGWAILGISHSEASRVGWRRGPVNPNGSCVAGTKPVSCDSRLEESLFEEALRQMSMNAFRAVVESGVYDADGFLNLGEDQLRAVSGVSSEAANEVVSVRNEMIRKIRSHGYALRPPRVQVSQEMQHDSRTQTTMPEQTSCFASGARVSGSQERAGAGKRSTGETRDGRSPSHVDGAGRCLGDDRADLRSSTAQSASGAAFTDEILVAETEPIPEVLLTELSTRARNIVLRNRITRVAHLLSLSEAELRSLPNAGTKTVKELMQLQDKLREYLTPELRRGDLAAPKRGSRAASTRLPSRQRSLWEPEEWSILRRPLRVVCGSCRRRSPTELGSPLVRDLSLSPKDLEALYLIAVFLDDSLDDVQSLSFGILVDSGISDDGLSSLLTGLCNRSGSRHECWCLEAVTATPIVQSSDLEGLPRAWIQVFGVPSRVGDPLNAFGILTFQDSLGISERDVIERLGFRAESLRVISRLWLLRRYSRIATLKMQDEGSAIRESLERALDGFLSSVARNPRERRIIERRLGVFDGQRWTLAELGAAEGMSREGVRQIEARSMRRIRHYRSQAILRPIWDAMEHILRRSGGACTTSELCGLLRQCFGWASTPRESHIVFIAGIGRRFDVVKSHDQCVITSRDPYPCLQCSIAQRWIVQLTDQTGGVISASEAAERLTGRCPPSCTLQPSRDRRFSEGYALLLASQTDGVRIEGSTILSSSAWKLMFGSVVEAVEAALLDAGRAVHFSELACSIRRSGRDITDQSVHACLSSRSDVALMWGIGEYIHRNYVQVPLRLIHSIEVTATKRLRSGIPLLSVRGLFEEHRTQLEREGIPTDRALYSCLRISDNPELVYTRYPYISLSESSSSRPTVHSVLEEFVREHEEGVSLTEIEDYLVSVLGVSDQLKSIYIGTVPNVIQVDDRLLIHLDHLSVDAARFRPIRDYIDRLLADVGRVSVDKVFNDRPVTCRVLGISTPTMLYSLLRTYCSERYALPRYPMVAMHGTEDQVGVSGIIMRYLREANAPCSLEQLAEYFGDRLGFKESTIYNAKYYEGIVQYAQGAVVHIEALGWTSEKQEYIERMAFDHLREQSLRGKPYGRLDLMTESDDLPRLPSCAPWTSVLLGELLCYNGNFRIIGTKRNSFVQIPNSYGIEDLQDLVYTLLDSEFGGAARLKEFVAYLRDVGILQRALTQRMLGDGSRVSVEGDVVRVTDD